MMKQKSNGRVIAFTLALALIFSTMFTGLGVPGFGQMRDKENWGVEEAYADADAAMVPTVNKDDKIIYANGIPLIVSQGAVGTTATAIYTSGGGVAAVVTFTELEQVTQGDVTLGYDLSKYTIYGGCSNAAIDATSITMTGGTVATVYGGGNNGAVSSTAVEISGGTASTVYGGGYTGAVTSTAVTMTGGTVTNTVYGGGYTVGATVSSTAVTISGGTVTNVYGGGINGAVTSTAVTMTGGTVTNTVYGGGYAVSATVSSTEVKISGNANITKNVYGGGYSGAVKGEAKVTISGNANMVDTVYGGGNTVGATVSSTEVKISGGTVATVYGGGFSEAVSSTAVEISGNANITKNVYGGGNTGAVSSTAVEISGNANITKNVYGGGSIGAVSSTAVGISGNANITQNVYGGGNTGAVSSTAVEISGNPTIGGIMINGGTTANGVDQFNIAGSLTGADGNIRVNLPSGFVEGGIFATSGSGLTDADAKKFTLTGSGASDKAIRVRDGKLVAVAVRGIGKVQNLSLIEGDGSLKATWGQPTGNDWGDITYRVKASGGSLVNWAYETTDTAYSFSGLTNGTVYTVEVSAVSNGEEGVGSVVTGTPKADSSTGGGRGSGGSTASSGSFSISKGDIKNVGNSNGQITFKNSSVKAGEKAVMTITANTAYEVGRVVVKDKDGKVIACKDNGDGTYSFTMPQSKVTVDVEYAPVFEEKKNTPSFDRTILSKQKVTLNGKSVEMDAYNVDGYNYMKLRDIAYLLKDTGAKFEVAAGSSYSITASPGKNYTAVGGEMEAGSDKAGTCVVSKWSVTIDGIERYLNVYNIGGNNYFKLVDMGQLLGFGVVYEQATNTAGITTK